MSEPSKYAENQFLVATTGRYPLMSEVLADTLPRATTATAGNPAFAGVLNILAAAADAWDAGASTIANAEAALPASTLAFDDKMASLTRKPDAETPSLLETWDTTIRGQVAIGGSTYLLLLPNGRETLTTGTREEQLDALRDFATRLSSQAGKPPLVALGATVSAFYDTVRDLRNTQTTAKAASDTARTAQEPRRIGAAAALYALVGQGMVEWSAEPEKVDTLFDVNILRNARQTVPDAPVDTTWDAASRTLSTRVLPVNATRIEAWRVGPGSMPELLLTAGPGQTSLVIPATITFTPGALYQLWLCGLNSKGRSTPGPVQNWTAV